MRGLRRAQRAGSALLTNLTVTGLQTEHSRSLSTEVAVWLWRSHMAPPDLSFPKGQLRVL